MTSISPYPLRPLGEVCENHDSRRLPVKAADRKPGPFPYYGAQGIVDYVDDYIFDGSFVLVAEDGENLRSRNQDIALPASGKFWVNNHAHIIRGNTEASTRFLQYAINSSDISGFITGSTIPKLSQKNLHSIPIPCPTLVEQDEIVSILGSLDEKIELNHRMNKTLESMARAIFKDWFVDFGPTRAKAEGREPYLVAKLWDLFPDMLDNGDKPVGWSVSPVSDLFKFNPHESVKKGTYTPYLNMAALPTSGMVADHPIHREYKSGSKFRDGDALFSRITPCLENGKTAYVFNMGNDIVGTGSTEFIVIRSRTPLPAPASYFLARDPEFRAHAERSMTGTSGRQRASREALSQYKLAAPTDDQLWKALGDFVTPLMDRVIANALESRALAQTRDLLLPKLMSGEIRVGEAEMAMEAVL